jgi:hypothetical protein
MKKINHLLLTIIIIILINIITIFLIKPCKISQTLTIQTQVKDNHNPNQTTINNLIYLSCKDMN